MERERERERGREIHKQFLLLKRHDIERGKVKRERERGK
jgi:hypothetical protein